MFRSNRYILSKDAAHKWFQSLFYWMRLLNKPLVRALSFLPWFQSLFYWMRLLNHWEGCLDSSQQERFNPCFIGCASWIGQIATALQFDGCFNPCFIGCASWILLSCFYPHYIYQFQSLFYWMRLLNSPARLFNDSWINCFNPCFIGCASWIPGTDRMVTEP